MRINYTLLPALGCLLCCYARAQTGSSGKDTIEALTLSQCVEYALQHQPAVNQSLINREIAGATNAINLGGWLPQANITGSLIHYNTLPTSFVKNSSGTVVQQRTGVINTATPVLSVTQTIFSPTLLYASRSAHLYAEAAELISDSTKIGVVAGVSKAFYGLLLTLEQINVLKEDTARLAKNAHDTYHQYVSGIVDETDYDEASISLNNSKAQLAQASENIGSQYALLRQVMGYPPAQPFNVRFDTAQMMKNIAFDTTLALQYQQRVEYRQLETAKKLQRQEVAYYRNAWLPAAGAFFDYDLAYQSNSFGSLFANSYPYSYVGVSLSLPLFTGFARTNSLRRARLQEKLLDWDEAGLQSQVYAEYAGALAGYKGNLYNLYALKENTDKAKRVYGIVELQYQQGVVAYLNVITAESNLINSEIGYLNALFQVLSSKIDLEKAMGAITVPH